MSTIRATPGPPDRPQRDPFFYGWREVYTKDEHGRCQRVLQPLTPEDVLHPQEGDYVTQNPDHDWDCDYLRDVIRYQVKDKPDTLVFHDVKIFWDVPGLEGEGHSPDLSLIRKVQQPHRRRESFHVAREGVRPELIIEVTSPSTRDVDLNDKKREYWLAQVPVYVIVEEYFRRGKRHLRILPFQRGPRSYRRQRLNARGRFRLEAVQLWIGQENGRVALYDAQGKRLEGYDELAEARKQVAQSLEQEAEARKQVEQSLEQEAEARKRAQQSLEQEAEARRKAEEELARLQVELRRLRGEEGTPS